MDDAKKVEWVLKSAELIRSGWAGINRLGNLVDRRLYKEAIPLEEDAVNGVPRPKNESDIKERWHATRYKKPEINQKVLGRYEKGGKDCKLIYGEGGFLDRKFLYECKAPVLWREDNEE